MLLEHLRFHHAGIACRDITREAAVLASLGYRPEGPEFTDAIQGVRGMFLGGQMPRVELLQPLSDEPGVLTPWLRGATKIYHFGYETTAMVSEIERLRKEGAKLVGGPVPAVAFGGREIAFLMLPNNLLVELIQSA